MSIDDRAKMTAKTSSSTIRIDKLEAKTLLECINALHILIQKDIDRFLEYDLSFRTSLFKQFSFILEISYSVYKGYSQLRKALYDKNKNMPLMMGGPSSNASFLGSYGIGG
jgi:hypothetical protein